MINYKKIISVLILFLSLSNSQEELDALIKQVFHGVKDSAQYSLPKIEREYPNNPSVLFLKGLLEINGKKATEIFTRLHNKYPTSEYGDDAVMKVAEYYYAAGLYVQASDWLKKMPIYYSRSIHIERAVKLFLNSLIVSGHKDTAVFYSKVFQRQFPDLDVNSKINALINDLEQSMIEKNKSSKSNKIENVKFDTLIKEHSKNKTLEDEMFTIQVGAYSLKNNAELQRIDLTVGGFSARVVELFRNNNVLYAVRVGNFATRADAQKTSNRIKSSLDLNTIIVINEK